MRPDHPAVGVLALGLARRLGLPDTALLPGDALLIAGKGHETGQTIGQDVLPFDDLEQASVAVAALDGFR